MAITNTQDWIDKKSFDWESLVCKFPSWQSLSLENQTDKNLKTSRMSVNSPSHPGIEVYIDMVESEGRCWVEG